MDRRPNTASPDAGPVRSVDAGSSEAGPGRNAAASPAAYCAKVGDDDETHNIPAALVPDARRLNDFEEQDSDRTVQEMTAWRCMSGRVWICNYGANLPCWKGDDSRTSKGGDEFCAENPDADEIPMVATGHGTVYRWRCKGRKAVPDGPPLAMDRRGFIAKYWDPL